MRAPLDHDCAFAVAAPIDWWSKTSRCNGPGHIAHGRQISCRRSSCAWLRSWPAPMRRSAPPPRPLPYRQRLIPAASMPGISDPPRRLRSGRSLPPNGGSPRRQWRRARTSPRRHCRRPAFLFLILPRDRRMGRPCAGRSFFTGFTATAHERRLHLPDHARPVRRFAAPHFEQSLRPHAVVRPAKTNDEIRTCGLPDGWW